jgi:hypothetical protein
MFSGLWEYKDTVLLSMVPMLLRLMGLRVLGICCNSILLVLSNFVGQVLVGISRP